MAKAYKAQLDGLRAIAIGLVGVEHFGGHGCESTSRSGRERWGFTCSSY
jgi:peptidoglycan/LPS O-acetylase OafA/YrhL